MEHLPVVWGDGGSVVSRGRHRFGRVWLVSLVVFDVLMGSFLWSSEGPGPVVVAALIAGLVAVFHGSRRRSSRARH